MSKSEIYYKNQYRKDFQAFWDSLDRHGSVSRCRGSILRQGMNTGAYQDSRHFSCWDLSLLEHDHLRNIKEENIYLFACSLFYTILIDQIMFSHFYEQYKEFEKLTRYPKMDCSCEWSGGIDMARPYAVFYVLTTDESFSYFSKLPIRLDSEKMLVTFTDFAPFILEDLDAFFTTHPLHVSIQDIFDAILRDEDCTYGEYGAILKQAVETR